MKTTEFNNKVTAAKLNESMFKKFGVRINFEKYDREQLEDYRNKLRTEIHQAESSSNFNDLLTNETYQKNKYVVSVLNAKIKEMLGESKLNEKAVSKAQQKFMGMVHAAQKGEKPASKEVAKVAKGMSKKAAKDYASTKHKGLPAHVDEASKPDFLDVDKDGNKKETFKKAIKDKTMKKTNEAAKAKKDFDKDGKVESPKAEYKGSKDRAIKKAMGKNVKEEMKVGDTRKSGTGGTITKTKTGIVHKAGSGKYGGNAGARDEYGYSPLDDKEDAPAKAKKTKKVKESVTTFRRHVKIVNESLRTLINEDEEGKAKAITAASDMVNDFTSWMQRVGQYQTKSMIELADAIRSEFGQAESDAFKQTVAPALESTLDMLTQQREAISHAVAVLAGEATEVEPMGMEPGAGEVGPDAMAGDEFGEPGADLGGDEFGAADAAAGGVETAGREIRESKQVQKARKLAEAHNLMRSLSK